MNLEKICFKNINDVMYLLRRNMDELNFISKEDLVNKMKESLKILTVHLYPQTYRITKSKKYIESNRINPTYNQLYFTINENKIYSIWCNGLTSGGRERHNFFIDAFLKNKKLRDKTITSVIVNYKTSPLSYYFYEGYAYCNHDIGNNWDMERKTHMYNRLKRSNLPYTKNRMLGILEGSQITFNNHKEKITIYSSLKKEINSRLILENTREDKDR